MKHKVAWGSIELSRYAVSGEDQQGPAFAAHRFLGRRGAQQEKLTDGMPRKVALRLNFTNTDERIQVMDAILDSPRDVLVHPDVGRMRAVLQFPVKATWNWVEVGEKTDVELHIEEDQLDVNPLQNRGPVAHAQEVKERASATSAASAALRQVVQLKYTVGTTAQRYRALAELAFNAVTDFVTKCQTYADAVLKAAETGEWDPAIELFAKELSPALEKTVTAVRKVGRAESWQSIQAAELTFYSVVQTEGSRRAAQAAPIVWTVRSKITLSVFVARVYPGADFNRRWELVDQIRRMNRLSRSDCLQPGQTLVIPGGAVERAPD